MYSLYAPHRHDDHQIDERIAPSTAESGDVFRNHEAVMPRPLNDEGKIEIRQC